jgi:hypothetical protein
LSRTVWPGRVRAGLRDLVALVTYTLNLYQPDHATEERIGAIAKALYRQKYTEQDLRLLLQVVDVCPVLSEKSKFRRPIVPRDFGDLLVRATDEGRQHSEKQLEILLSLRPDLSRKDFGVVGSDCETGEKFYIRLHREEGSIEPTKKRSEPPTLATGRAGITRGVDSKP